MKRIIYALLMMTIPAFGQGVRYDSNVTTVAGNVPAGAKAPIYTLPNAIVTICTFPGSGSPCTNTVPIYNDQALTSAMANPLTADAQGRFGFWIAPGVYSYSVQNPDGTFVGTYSLSLDSPQGPQGPGGIGCGAANCIVSEPTTTQTIAQASGTSLNVNVINNVEEASLFAGADAGAKINAADTALGANPGTIIYSSSTSDSATTSVTLSANHKLILQSPISWTATITLPDNSSGQDISCPALQTLSYATASTWISGKGNSNVSVHDCNIASTITAGTLDTVAAFNQATNVSITNNSVTNAGLAVFVSSAANTSCPDGTQCQYPNVTPGNSSSQITISGNHGTASTGEFIFLNYTNGATISGNVADGYNDGIVWWGGDSCVAGCTAGQNGAMTNARKATNLTIADNVLTSLKNACIWGSMGQYVTISGNNCLGVVAGTDVGIDLEGTWDSTVSHNTVSGFLNGDLATFFLSTRASFLGNSATGVTGATLLVSTHNSTNTPDGLIQTFSGNDLNCTAAGGCDTQFQSAEIYNVVNNHFHDTMLTLNGLNISQAFISGNDFSFDVAADHAILASTSSGSAMSPNGLLVLRDNIILSSATQASGKAAIMASGSDFNNPSNIRIEGNRTDGTSAFPVDIECNAASANPGIPTYCSILNNLLGTNSIVTNNAGSGALVHVQSVNNNLPSNYQTFGFTGGLSNSGFGVDGSGNITSTPIKSTTGARYVCVDTNGKLISQAAACSGT